MSKPRILLVLLVAASPVGATGQVFRYLAYGDSITEGFNDSAVVAGEPLCNACPNPAMTPPGCGYPKVGAGRLPALLGCSGTTCEIVNHGLFSRKTGEDITRLNTILATDSTWDVMILMHGSNDLFADPPIPEEVVRDNLKKMAYNTALLGIDTLHASIIRFHYLGRWGTNRDDEIDNLGLLVQSLALGQNRTFSDQRAALCGTLSNAAYRNCQNSFYCEDDPSKPSTLPWPNGAWIIGHPAPDGFDVMSAAFSDAITAAGLPTRPTPGPSLGDTCTPTPSLSWTKESPDRATWYNVQVATDTGTIVFDEWLPESATTGLSSDPTIAGACTGASCSAAPSPLAVGDYVWRVRGRNSQGRSIFSTDSPFRVVLATDLTLEDETVLDVRHEASCQIIRAGNFGAGDYVVGATGNLTLHAGIAVEIHNGFSVLAGGSLTAIADL